MNQINTDQLLRQMREMSQRIEGLEPTPQSGLQSVNQFTQLLKDSVNKVNEVQKNAGDLAMRFDAGDESVNLADVMINLQKASISFQAMTQVRNRLVSAYQDIMNMQI